MKLIKYNNLMEYIYLFRQTIDFVRPIQTIFDALKQGLPKVFWLCISE